MRSRSILFCVVLIVSALAQPVYAMFSELPMLESVLKEVSETSPLKTLAEQLSTQSPLGTFRDVDSVSWYAPFVAAMVRRGIVSGDLDSSGKPLGTFRPQDYVTVAEAVKIVLRAAQIDEKPCTLQTRNAQAMIHWARPFVACAEGLGVRIITPQTFLDRTITRAEALTLIDDVFADELPALTPTFSDSVRHRYAQDIAYNAAAGIVSGDRDSLGKPTGKFRPDDPLRRSEMVKIMANKLELWER